MIEVLSECVSMLCLSTRGASLDDLVSWLDDLLQIHADNAHQTAHNAPQIAPHQSHKQGDECNQKFSVWPHGDCCT